MENQTPTITNNTVLMQDVEYIKISTSVRGVITWDFKILGLDIEKAKQINKELEEAFPRYAGLTGVKKTEEE